MKFGNQVELNKANADTPIGVSNLNAGLMIQEKAAAQLVAKIVDGQGVVDSNGDPLEYEKFERSVRFCEEDDDSTAQNFSNVARSGDLFQRRIVSYKKEPGSKNLKQDNLLPRMHLKRTASQKENN